MMRNRAHNEYTILIVDDNQDNLRVLGSILEREGYEIAMAMDGGEALQVLEAVEPDIILLDVMMPVIDGFKVCETIQQNVRFQDVPIIFLSAKHETEDIVKGFKIGGVDYVSKPFIKEELLVRVKTHLKLRQSMMELKNIAMIDALTGAFNRHYAYDMITKKLKLVEEHGERLILAYIDVDCLKEINDTCGHKEGDRLLSALVRTLQGELKCSDCLFRMGGDEFVVLFMNTSKDEVEERLCAVNGQLQVLGGFMCSPSFSVGFAECTQEKFSSMEELIDIADHRMYEQKARKKRRRTDIMMTSEEEQCRLNDYLEKTRNS